MEVSQAVAMRTYASNYRYQDCCCDPNMSLVGHEDLMAALTPDTINAVVVVADTRALEVL